MAIVYFGLGRYTFIQQGGQSRLLFYERLRQYYNLRNYRNLSFSTKNYRKTIRKKYCSVSFYRRNFVKKI